MAEFNRLLPARQVADLTGLHLKSVHRLGYNPEADFPAPVRVSPGRIAWRETEIQAWLDSRQPVIDKSVDG